MTTESSREKNLETCLVISTGLIVLWFFNDREWLLGVAAVVGGVGLFVPPLASAITWIWYKIAEVLGLFVPKVLLSVIFFLFLLPLALIYRLFSKDILQLNKKPEGSYWVDRDHRYSGEDLEKIW